MRTETIGRSATGLDYGLALVVVAFIITFAWLRVAHARQIEATRQAVFAFSFQDRATFEMADELARRTGLRLIDLNGPSSKEALRQLGLEAESSQALLALPSPKGWTPVKGEAAIGEVLSTLQGVPTAYLRGAFAALFLAALWLAGRTWRRPLAYLGTAWPVVGAAAVGVAAPLCPGCLLGQDALSPSASLLGLGVFAVVLTVFGMAPTLPRRALAGLGGIALAGGLGQAVLLAIHPKLCVPCVLAGFACTGIWAISREGLATERLRTLRFGRPAVAVASALILILAFQHARVAIASAGKEGLRDFHSLEGSRLPKGMKTRQLGKPSLVLVTLPRCQACDLAKESLNAEGIAYSTLPYCTLGNRAGCLEPDFDAVSPLLLFCDANGIVRRAEAGWTTEPFAREQILNRIRNHLGKME